MRLLETTLEHVIGYPNFLYEKLLGKKNIFLKDSAPFSVWFEIWLFTWHQPCSHRVLKLGFWSTSLGQFLWVSSLRAHAPETAAPCPSSGSLTPQALSLHSFVFALSFLSDSSPCSPGWPTLGPFTVASRCWDYKSASHSWRKKQSNTMCLDTCLTPDPIRSKCLGVGD